MTKDKIYSAIQILRYGKESLNEFNYYDEFVLHELGRMGKSISIQNKMCETIYKIPCSVTNIAFNVHFNESLNKINSCSFPTLDEYGNENYQDELNFIDANKYLNQ